MVNSPHHHLVTFPLLKKKKKKKTENLDIVCRTKQGSKHFIQNSVKPFESFPNEQTIPGDAGIFFKNNMYFQKKLIFQT
jgi:hypothetical protein